MKKLADKTWHVVYICELGHNHIIPGSLHAKIVRNFIAMHIVHKYLITGLLEIYIFRKIFVTVKVDRLAELNCQVRMYWYHSVLHGITGLGYKYVVLYNFWVLTLKALVSNYKFSFCVSIHFLQK